MQKGLRSRPFVDRAPGLRPVVRNIGENKCLKEQPVTAEEGRVLGVVDSSSCSIDVFVLQTF